MRRLLLRGPIFVATTALLIFALSLVYRGFFPYVAIRNDTLERTTLLFDGESIELDSGAMTAHRGFVGDHSVVRSSHRWVLHSSIFDGKLLSLGTPRCFEELYCEPGFPAFISSGGTFRAPVVVPERRPNCRSTHARGEIISIADPYAVRQFDCSAMP